MNNNLKDAQINEWSANECGQSIEYYDYPKKWMWQMEGSPCMYWDFRDARCMAAVIRGHFGIETNWSTPTEGVFEWESCSNIGSQLVKGYTTPGEADCACLIKIFEAFNEQ